MSGIILPRSIFLGIRFLISRYFPDNVFLILFVQILRVLKSMKYSTLPLLRNISFFRVINDDWSDMLHFLATKEWRSGKQWVFN